MHRSPRCTVPQTRMKDFRVTETEMTFTLVWPGLAGVDTSGWKPAKFSRTLGDNPEELLEKLPPPAKSHKKWKNTKPGPKEVVDGVVPIVFWPEKNRVSGRDGLLGTGAGVRPVSDQCHPAAQSMSQCV